MAMVRDIMVLQLFIMRIPAPVIPESVVLGLELDIDSRVGGVALGRDATGLENQRLEFQSLILEIGRAHGRGVAEIERQPDRHREDRRRSEHVGHVRRQRTIGGGLERDARDPWLVGARGRRDEQEPGERERGANDEAQRDSRCATAS